MSNCEVCGAEVEGYEPEMCCSGFECGCGGMPMEPCICSDDCWDELNKPAPVVARPIQIRAIEINNLGHNICGSPLKSASLNVKTDREPVFIYERVGNSFFAEDSGFVSTYQYVSGSTDGFARRSISLPMRDGSTFETKGSLWASSEADQAFEKSREAKLYHLGQASDAAYRKCPVYCSAAVTEDIFLSLAPNFLLRT